MHNSYKEGGNFHSYHYQNDLANARFTHLVELVQKFKYQSRLSRDDHIDLLMRQFEGRRANIAGNEINIWENIVGEKPEVLEKWIDRWIDKKSGSMSEKDWYAKYYNNFYDNTYTPYMDNLALYLLGDNRGNDPDFWKWYLGTYLRENLYPKF